MKIKITRVDGTVIEAEGTEEEMVKFLPSILPFQFNFTPPFYYSYPPQPTLPYVAPTPGPSYPWPYVDIICGSGGNKP